MQRTLTKVCRVFSVEALTELGFVEFTNGLANYTQDTETWAVYGQVGYDLTDRLNLHGSLRYTDEDKDIDYPLSHGRRSGVHRCPSVRSRVLRHL